MPIMTVWETIEMLSKLNSSELIFTSIYTKGDVSDISDNGFTATDEDWKKILDEFECDNLLDTINQYFTDSMANQLNKFRCEDCYGYDYDVIRVGKSETKTCKSCGESQDVVY